MPRLTYITKSKLVKPIVWAGSQANTVFGYNAAEHPWIVIAGNVYGQSDQRSWIYLRFNGDNGSNYSMRAWRLDGTSVGIDTYNSQTQMMLCRVGNVGATFYMKAYLAPHGKRRILKTEASYRYDGPYNGSHIYHIMTMWHNTVDVVNQIQIWSGSTSCSGDIRVYKGDQ